MPAAAQDEEILRAHESDYLRRLVDGEPAEAELRRIGIPWTPQVVERSRRASARQ